MQHGTKESADKQRVYSTGIDGIDAVRETGSMIRAADAIHTNAVRINSRLDYILRNLRGSPPDADANGCMIDQGPQSRPPLCDVMECTEREQLRTVELLGGIESLIG